MQQGRPTAHKISRKGRRCEVQERDTHPPAKISCCVVAFAPGFRTINKNLRLSFHFIVRHCNLSEWGKEEFIIFNLWLMYLGKHEHREKGKNLHNRRRSFLTIRNYGGSCES